MWHSIAAKETEELKYECGAACPDPIIIAVLLLILVLAVVYSSVENSSIPDTCPGDFLGVYIYCSITIIVLFVNTSGCNWPIIEYYYQILSLISRYYFRL